MKIRFWIILLWFMTHSAQGQHSENKTFNAFLKTVITDDVIAIDASELEPEKVILLDTRSRAEYEKSHIKSAKWVGYDDFDLSRVEMLDKKAAVIVYCSVGVRSGKIGKKLKEAGFKDVKNLYGGIFEWYNRGLPVYNEKGETDDIHTYNFIWSVWVNKRN